MTLIANKGSSVVLRTGAVYLLEPGPAGRWKLLNHRGQRFTARGRFNFVRIGARYWVSKSGEHLHISRGVDIVYAGEMRFGYNGEMRGRLKEWSNASGHYRPPVELAAQAGLPMELFRPIEVF